MAMKREIIERILMQEDIEGLIEAGAPQDEYADEAAQLAAAIEIMNVEERSKEAISSALAIIWVNSFELADTDLKLRLDAIERVSQQIYSGIES